VIVDRCLQARVVNALEPEWEARFEPRSYGFRPGRGCHDAIDAIFHIARGANPRRCWALDADLAAAFDRIDHSHLLSQLCTFPDRGLIADWLKAGMIDRGRFSPTAAEQVEDVVVATLESSPEHATHWSRKKMAERSGLSKSTIGRIWKGFSLKPHLTAYSVARSVRNGTTFPPACPGSSATRQNVRNRSSASVVTPSTASCSPTSHRANASRSNA